MRTPTIDEFMTKTPQCIEWQERVVDAYKLMRETKCRHLPVLKNGKLIGIVSQRGLYRLETLLNVDRAQDPVLDAMDEAFVVAPGTPVTRVAAEMARSRIGAAVIAEGGNVLGIFTTNDALDALVAVIAMTNGPDLSPRARPD